VKRAEHTFGQPGAGVRFDWGVAGAGELSRVCAALVVVDVLSFTTTVDIAVSRGMRVHPFPWSDQAPAYARRVGAEVAVGRSEVTAEQPWSLSPAAMAAARVVPELVLPSPNGSTICAAAAATGAVVLAGCVRNAAAVGDWLARRDFGSADKPVGVIAAGERWPDGNLRPSVEDLIGAGLIIDRLVKASGGLSIEAAVTLAARAQLTDVSGAVHGSVSGQELIALGFAPDVALAAAAGTSGTVPVLRDGAFRAAVH